MMLPAAGIAVGFFAFVLWVLPVGLRWLDGLVASLFTVGLVLSGLGYRSDSLGHRQLAVLGIGVCGAGLLTLALLYAAG
jgi:hypothetical protein